MLQCHIILNPLPIFTETATDPYGDRHDYNGYLELLTVNTSVVVAYRAWRGYGEAWWRFRHGKPRREVFKQGL